MTGKLPSRAPSEPCATTVAFMVRSTSVNWQARSVKATNCAAVLRTDDGYQLQPGASADEIRDAAAALGTALPHELVSLYRVSNGVFDGPGQWFVIWRLVDVVARNRQAWALEGLVRQGLVGFADDGTGAPFCVSCAGGNEVLAWSPIDGVGVVVAESIEEFWANWTRGTLTS